MLVSVAVHCLSKLVTEQSRKDDGMVDFEKKACLYLVNLLQKMVQNEEPNKIFKWTKTDPGPRKTPAFMPLVTVAIPETRRRAKQSHIRNALAAKNITREALIYSVNGYNTDHHLKLHGDLRNASTNARR
jgi:hypothetical protein